MKTHLGTLLSQLHSVLKLGRVDAHSLEQAFVCNLRNVGLLRSDACRQNKLLGRDSALPSRSLEFDFPMLGRQIILSGLDLC